jgi:hypothetical protein
MNIAIVTSCHNYGEYLQDWAESITKLILKPALCVIVDNASTDDTAMHMERAAATLRAAGLKVVTEQIPGLVNFGAARNRAVELTDTEWVMHLDADDMVLPYALSDAAAIAPRADVIAFGYQRCGDLRSGPSNLTRVYSASQGPSTLKSSAPASGVSPFRRVFWENTPYRTDMSGGWDTALWLGFAHMNARFVPTRRPVFYYRQHADSIFNIRRLHEVKTAFVGAKLESLRRADSGVSVLIPWAGDDGGPRQRALQWLLKAYAEQRPEWEVILGTCDRPWRKGVAVNRALYQAHGEVVIVADADCFVSLHALDVAVECVRAGAPWVIPHKLVHRLDEPSALALVETGSVPEQRKLIRHAYEGFAGGGMFVIERAKLDAVRGYPERFTGWGAEDESMALVLDTLVGQRERLDADLWHLWHPPGLRQNDPEFQKNRQIYQRYAAAVDDEELMWAIVTDKEGAVGPNQVRMLALADFPRGMEQLRKGDRFWASPEEARRHAMRGKRLAVPLTAIPRERIVMGGPVYTNQGQDLQDKKLAAANPNRGG